MKGFIGILIRKRGIGVALLLLLTLLLGYEMLKVALNAGLAIPGVGQGEDINEGR